MGIFSRAIENIKTINWNNIIVIVSAVVVLSVSHFIFYPQLLTATLDFLRYFFSLTLWVESPQLKGLNLVKILVWISIILFTLLFLLKDPNTKFK